jgi:uncharacterized protein (TIGR00255 family)
VTHLPQEFFGVEPFIYKFLNEKINRGRVDAYVTMEKTTSAKKLKLDSVLFKSSMESFEKMYREAGITQAVSAELVINKTEGIVSMEDAQAVPGNQDFGWENVKPALEKAYDDFMKMKSMEGERLLEDIGKKAAIIGLEAGKVKAQFDLFKEDYINKTREKIARIFAKEDAKQFVSTEVVEVLDKHDITEELVRISSHLKQLEAFITGRETAGRKIDFLAQELYRESNTIGSKIGDPVVSHSVIVMKEHTEKIREQAQNLE